MDFDKEKFFILECFGIKGIPYYTSLKHKKEDIGDEINSTSTNIKFLEIENNTNTDINNLINKIKNNK